MTDSPVSLLEEPLEIFAYRSWEHLGTGVWINLRLSFPINFSVEGSSVTAAWNAWTFQCLSSQAWASFPCWICLCSSFIHCRHTSGSFQNSIFCAKIRIKYNCRLHFITGTCEENLGGPLEKSLMFCVVLYIVSSSSHFGAAEFSGVIQKCISVQKETVL